MAVVATLLGAGLWAGHAGPFAPARTPWTIYVHLSPGATESLPSATASVQPTPSGPTPSGPTPSGTAESGTAAPETTVAVPTPFRPATFTLAKPNLQFAFHTVPNVICGVSFTMNIGVRNAGPVAAGPNNMFLFDQYPDMNTLAMATAHAPALPAGGTVNVPMTFTVSSGCGQSHIMRLRIDGSASIDESDEEDNFLVLTHTVRGPNLYLTDLYVPAHPTCGSVTVGVRVNNNGTAGTYTAGLVKFTDTYTGVPSYSKSVYVSFPTVAAGTSRIVSQTFPPLQYCNHQHTLTAVVDPSNDIPETNEGNNTASITFHPDL